jgi:hypothetical protein
MFWIMRKSLVQERVLKMSVLLQSRDIRLAQIRTQSMLHRPLKDDQTTLPTFVPNRDRTVLNRIVPVVEH